MVFNAKLKHYFVVAVLCLLLAASITCSSAPKVVNLYMDKPSWVPNLDQVMAIAPKDISTGYKAVPYADTNSYQSAIRTSLSSKNAPDLFTWWSGYRMADLAETGLLEDLSPVWKKYTASKEYSPDLMKAFTFQGKTYAVPFNLAYWVVFYNKKVFSDNGLTVPKIWADLMKVADTVKAKGVTPFATTVENRWPGFIWFEELLVRSNPDFYEKLMAGKASYDDETVVKVFKLWKEMSDKGYFCDPQVTMSPTANSWARLFSQGKLAMILDGNWYAQTINDTGMKPGEDYGTFIMPNVNASVGPVVIYEVSPLIMAKNGANKKATLKLVDYWMSAKAQQKWTDLMGFTPPNALVKPELAFTAELSNEISGKRYRLVQRYWEATPPEIVEPAVDEMCKFVINPNSSPEVITNLKKIADAYWQSKKKK